LIKIVYIVSTLRKSGPANQLRSLIEHLDRRSFSPFIITLSPEPRNSAAEDFKPLNVEIFSLELSRAQSFFRAPRMLKEKVRRLSPAIIHTHGIRADLLSALFLEGCRRVSTIHNFPFEDYPLTYGRIPGYIMAKAHTRMLAGIEAPVGCSGAISSWFREKQNLQTDFINNGIDTSAFRKLPPEGRSNLREKLKIPPDSLVFISAGHLNRRKDPLTLLEAFGKSARPGNLLILLGDGNLRARCVKKAGNMPHVRIEGRVDNVREYMQASDVFVSASLSEGFPLSVLEAFSTGLYCMLSDIPPHAEAAGYLPDSAALFPKRDVSALCKTLVSAEERLPDFDSGLSAELAGNIFDASSMSGKYQALYDNLRDKEKI